ncbi:unnamed protein product, partial [Tilletia controversa]
MSSVHSNSPGPGEADDSLEFSSEESIREAIATDLAKSLAVIAEMDGISVAVRDRMVTGAETYWGRQLEQRLEARAQLVAEHEAREAAAKAARDAQAQRELEAQQQLEAKKTHDSTVPKYDIQKGVGPSEHMDAWWPAKSILRKIERGEYDFDLWHLTREGAEASHAAALKGGGQLFRSENGTIRVEEHVEQGTKDADLTTEQWISATALLEQWAQRK